MIIRTYGCETCGHYMEVELRADQWDQTPPDCPRCASGTHQEFVPPAIGGSTRGKAIALAEDIARHDYGVADMQLDKAGGAPKVRYQDASPGAGASGWGVNQEVLEGAIALGRQTRMQHGSGLDVLQHLLKTGEQPDLLAASKRRSLRVF